MDDDSASTIVQDLAAVSRIDVVPSLLRIVCETTGMGFSAVARVTAGTWTACAVHDDIQFGLQPGGQLYIQTTLCRESREARAQVVIDHASQDPQYKDHCTPRIYGIESYISVPIVLPMARTSAISAPSIRSQPRSRIHAWSACSWASRS